jgi:hypothetical protein
MQRRLMAWRAGSESINSLILQGGEPPPLAGAGVVVCFMG